MREDVSSTDVKDDDSPNMGRKREDLYQGWTKFVTFAALCNFKASIDDKIDPELLSSETAPMVDDKQGKIEKRAKYQNVVAVAQLAMAFSTDTAMLFLYKGMSNPDWPNGLAYLVGKTIKK